MKKKPQKKIHVIITGGTIDKSYDPAGEISVPNEKSIVPHYLNDIIKPHFASRFKTVCLLDSADITENMRKKILQAIKTANGANILITHGTTALAKTADFIKKNLGKNQEKKIIILTGAMIPMKELAMSDGGFNLGFAIASFECLKPGVYIAMNGKIFKAGTARKNIKKARFEDAL